jgi:hypothetical protein
MCRLTGGGRGRERLPTSRWHLCTKLRQLITTRLVRRRSDRLRWLAAGGRSRHWLAVGLRWWRFAAELRWRSGTYRRLGRLNRRLWWTCPYSRRVGRFRRAGGLRRALRGACPRWGGLRLGGLRCYQLLGVLLRSRQLHRGLGQLVRRLLGRCVWVLCHAVRMRRAPEATL